MVVSGMHDQKFHDLFYEWMHDRTKSEEAIQDYIEDAYSGDALAMYKIGEYFSVDDGRPRWSHTRGVVDFDYAVYWLYKAAEAGSVDATVRLAELYELDDDTVLCLKWLRKAADLGHSKSMVGLAWFYIDGQHVERSMEEWAYWLLNAAELGELEALKDIEDLGENFFEDEAKDLSELNSATLKAMWYRQEALRGDKEAMAELSQAYEKGLGVPIDKELAKYWLDQFNRDPIVGSDDEPF